jgi:Rrf2 family protein
LPEARTRAIGTCLRSCRIQTMKRNNSSMQLTRAADYGIRVMVHLATLAPGERTLLPALAQATGAPESFLSKVLQALSSARLIASRRGHTGGFEILPRGRRASMREVIEIIDGPIHLNVCLMTDGTCGRKKGCPAHPVWVRAQKAMLDVLAGAVVADLASEQLALPERKPGMVGLSSLAERSSSGTAIQV